MEFNREQSAYVMLLLVAREFGISPTSVDCKGETIYSLISYYGVDKSEAEYLVGKAHDLMKATGGDEFSSKFTDAVKKAFEVATC